MSAAVIIADSITLYRMQHPLICLNPTLVRSVARFASKDMPTFRERMELIVMGSIFFVSLEHHCFVFQSKKNQNLPIHLVIGVRLVATFWARKNSHHVNQNYKTHEIAINIRSIRINRLHLIAATERSLLQGLTVGDLALSPAVLQPGPVKNSISAK